MVFDSFNGQVEASFGIALFYCGPAVRGLEPKEQHDSCPLAGDYTTIYLGILIVLWVYPHSHPPRMTDFISHAQESRYKLSELQFAFVELRRVESSSRGLLYLHLSTLLNSASAHDIEIYLLRRCRQSVSNMHDVGCKTKINIELESTLLLFLDKEMRHRPQLKFNSRCIAFQIASYLKKMFGCESRELAGSDSSQKSSDTMKRLILSNDC